MSIDPLSLLCALTAVITSFQKQYDDYNKLQDNKQESLVAFWKAVSRLTDDLRTYQKFIETVHEHQPGFARFIKFANSAADWDGFESTLADIQARYRELQGHELSGPAPKNTGVLKRITASLIFSDVLTSSIKRIDAATASLVSDTQAIERAYKRLYASYTLHIIHQGQKPATVRSDPSVLPMDIDTVVSSFHQNPFRLSTTTVPADTLFRLNQNRDVAERVTKGMKEEGASWAEKFIRSDTINEFSRIQRVAMDLLWAACIPQMESEELQFARLGDERVSNASLKDLSFGLKSAIARAKTQSFSIAFCGMVKAGKSLFLNALMSRTILPSDGVPFLFDYCISRSDLKAELPSTAWPCRLRHVPGQSIPTLTFDPQPFRTGLEKLQIERFGSKMQDYKPPSDDPFDDTPDIDVPDASTTDYSRIYYSWKALHQQTRKNLLEFETPGFKLLSNVEGRDQVAKLLGQLNDIVRLCYCFQLGFPSGTGPGELPLLCVEFESLRDQDIEGTFEFIDLPGLGEEFENFNYEDMITRVVTEANAVVPIVSFKEIAKQDWRKLPRIISSGLQTRASMVICTHFDQISRNNLEEQITTVAKVFWSQSSAAPHSVIPCSSKMGLSAAFLRRHPVNELPKFDAIWKDNPNDIGYPCVTAILGVADPRKTYSVFNAQNWRKAVEQQWILSGLPNALHRLTSDLVAQARQRVLVEEGMQFQKQVHKIIINQQRVLLEMRRSRDEFEAAREEFQTARDEFTNTLDVWSSKERLRDRDYDKKLVLHCEKLQKLGTQHVFKALEETSKSMSEMFSPDSEPCDFGAESTRGVFIGSRLQAEEFLYKSQQMLTKRLMELKEQFVSNIRKLADQANRDRIQSLREAIRAFRNDMESELRTEILVELESLAVNVRTLAFQTIQRSLKTERIRYSPSEIYRIFEGIVAKPILALQDDITDDICFTIKDLGLLVRAPVAAIATVPYVLSGAGVWLFMTKTKKYHCNMSILGKYYQDKIVTPFLQDLGEEGSKSLKSALTQSSTVAKATVEYALQREEARYKRESEEKDKMPTNRQVAELVASHLNFVAAESTFLFLKPRLLELIK